MEGSTEYNIDSLYERIRELESRIEVLEEKIEHPMIEIKYVNGDGQINMTGFEKAIELHRNMIRRNI